MKIPHRIVAWTVRIALCGGILSLTGCYLASVHPLALPHQRIFDPTLIGTWASGSDTLSVIGDCVDNMELTIIESAGIRQ